MINSETQRKLYHHHHHVHCRLLLLSLALVALATTCPGVVLPSLADSGSPPKPSIILILPQSFKLTTNQIQAESQEGQAKLQQYVTLINNVHNERDDQYLRQNYKKLSLQVRDAKSPITGQLFYEHVFDYFAPSQQHLLIPINLDQVSPVQEQLVNVQTLRSYAGALGASSVGAEQTVIKRPTQLIVSVRPHQLESGFGSDSFEFVSSAPVSIEVVSSSDGRRSFAVVQTDKPIYKPKEKVRIRALVVNENLRPVIKDELRLQIKNPHKIIVEEVRFPLSNQTIGFKNNEDSLYLDHIFEFPPEPMLGIWSAHVLHSDRIGNDTTSFEVKEYVLPTFGIQFESPKYILPSTKIINGFIVAKYHTGKPVQGKALLKFAIVEYSNVKTKFIARLDIKDIDTVSGRVSYKLNTARFKNTDMGWFPNIAGYRLLVEATVIEKSTGHREVAQDSSCAFISMPYRISFDDSIDDFKPGLSQQLTVQVLEIQTQQPAPPGSLITASYRDQNGTSIDPKSPSPDTVGYKLDEEAYTDSSGRVTFNIGPVPGDVTSIVATLRWLNITKGVDDLGAQTTDKPSATDQQATIDELAMGQHTLMRHESRNGWISIMNKSITHLNIGDEFVSDLLIHPDAAVIRQKIFYMILARGQIMSLDTVNLDMLVKFTINEFMVPSVRIVLFALTRDSIGLLSDSMRINIGQDLNCGLTMRYKSNSADKDKQLAAQTFRPDDKGKLVIKARQGDLISLIGVDSAVYTLNNRSRFDSSKIIQRIKKLDSGCGFGGGRDNLDVFHNAGLMLFKDQEIGDTQLGPTSNHLGTSCLTVMNQLKYIEDLQLGYSRPFFSAAAQTTNRPKIRRRMTNSANNADQHHRSRPKREVDIESILRRYKDPIRRACCQLGTWEDSPQHRNCSVRTRIVERYMRKEEFKFCPAIYADCCRAVFGEKLLLGSIFNGRSSIDPVVETKILAKNHAPMHSQMNVGHLDKIESETLVRKDFRETWLFELVNVIEADGSADLSVQLPHSITTWSVAAMALNRYQPMCVMTQPLKLTVFQEIFLQVSMPYRVIQGEQIDLLATIFNYSPSDQDVLAYMYGIEDVCSEAEPGERSEKRRVRIEKHSSQSVIFPIIPLKIGSYPIKILAVTVNYGVSDIVEKTLEVVPRGRPVTDETTFSLDPLNQQRRSKRAIETGNLLDEIDSSKGIQRSKVRLSPSRDSEFIVPQTQECIVSAIGDKMGQSVQTTIVDVENLIRLPHGCGEQVMIYLGPTLYTARYLSSINKLSGDSRWRAIRYIQSGYKRILNFRKEDGAFSAFARRDPSIWLTAFVAKMLCQTERTPFVGEEINVDKNVVNSALEWLVKKQNKESGTWIEMNPVYHREMLGGVLKENALTAFVTLTFNECSHHSSDLIDETVTEAEQKKESNFKHAQSNGVDKLKVATQKAEQALKLDWYKAVKERNPYVLALTTYALSVSRPRDAVEVLNDLMLLAERSHSRNQLYWRGDYQIETAAYALQALIELAPTLDLIKSDSSQSAHTGSRTNWSPSVDAIAIANWLSSKRSYTGAFESTQDTIVALEALSKFAQLQSAPANGNSLLPQSKSSPSLTCNVTMSNRTRRSIEFGKENSQVLQTFKLDSIDMDSINNEILDVVTFGNGIGTMSVKLKYNVFQDEDELCRFDISSSIKEWHPPIKMPYKKMDDGVREGTEEAAENHPNETIGDEFFKNFETPMLVELNIVKPNQFDHTSQKPSSSQQMPTTSSRREMLRFKRYAQQVAELSARTENNSADSWTTKVVSTLKSKLPTWLSPKATTFSPSTTTISPNSETNHYLSDMPRRANTSRRSAQSTGIPLIVQPSGIPDGVKLNTLSEQLDYRKNESETKNDTSSQQNVQQVLNHPSNRLILLLQVCVHHLSRRDSEMSVIEVGILSGFKPNEADLKEMDTGIGSALMKYEMSADKSLVVFYMKYIPFSGPSCFQFRLNRESLVYNLQSGYIRAYEYYSPTHSCSNFYTPARLTDSLETRCDSSGLVCQCATNSLCPSTKKLIDLGETLSVNATSARNKLKDLVCSNRYDFVSLVRLKNVNHLEAGKMFKLSVKVRSDLKGNLTKIMSLQRAQKNQLVASVRKPQHLSTASPSDPANRATNLDQVEEDETSLDYLKLSIDSNCVRNDPLLLHLAHPSQWKGGEHMILFGRYNKLEKRFFKVTQKSSVQARRITSPVPFPKPKANIFGGAIGQQIGLGGGNEKIQEAQMAALAAFEDSQLQQYSTTMVLDKDSILHDMTYQGKVEQREAINNLISWLDLRSSRDNWTCTV